MLPYFFCNLKRRKSLRSKINRQKLKANSQKLTANTPEASGSEAIRKSLRILRILRATNLLRVEG